MLMEDDCRGRVATTMPFREQTVPELRIFTATRRADAKALVEQPNPVKNLSTERHVRTGTQTPDRNAEMLGRIEERAIEIDRSVAPAPSRRVPVECLLGRCLEFAGQDESCQRHQVGSGQLARNGVDPSLVHL